MKLPALLISIDTKRNIARNKVRKAIENIKAYGNLVGFTEWTAHELSSVIKYMEQEMEVDEQRKKAEMVRSSQKRKIYTD